MNRVIRYNLVVIGGGLTGVSAAVSAARAGLKVLLVEKSGCLGGAMSNCLVYPFMRYWTEEEGRDRKWLSAGIFAEMRQRVQKYVKSDNDLDFSPEHFKFVLDQLIEEAGVQVLFHAFAFESQVEDRKIRGVTLATKAGSMQVEAEYFIDATGDGDLMAMSGCDFQLGRERDGLCQPMTTCFRVAGVDKGLLGPEERRRIKRIYKEQKEEGKIRNPREDVLMFTGKALGEGIVHFNTTRVVKLNPTDPMDVSRAEMEARKQICELLQFLKKQDIPAFRNAYLVSVASDIGIRESRKLRGEHILTIQELTACTRFPDAIALGNYEIDIHNPEGSGTSHQFFGPGEYYTIPYRSLLPKELDNLLVGGRCISATHEAQASIRIMPICATLGEAAGTAVALASISGTDTHHLDVSRLQEMLRSQGAAID